MKSDGAPAAPCSDLRRPGERPGLMHEAATRVVPRWAPGAATRNSAPSRQSPGWPLMRNNITRQDLDALIAFLRQGDPILTQASQVRAFEREWSEWLGVRYSVFVNSGSSANLLTLAALRHRHGPGEVIVPTLTWVSDIAAVLHCGFTPVFVDINLRTLGMDIDQVLTRLSSSIRAVFLTHVLGYNALEQRLLDELQRRGIPLIEDVCESHGAAFCGRKLGTFGLLSNFSFDYTHHLSTIEGGMICTDDPELDQVVRMLRSHGMVREATTKALEQDYRRRHPDLNPDFIFAYPAWNLRGTEINAAIGRSQLPRLDANNRQRTENLLLFLESLDPERYCTGFQTEGCSNHAFTLVLKHPDEKLRDRVEEALRARCIEFRRGTSGGGNQLRQPYLKALLGENECLRYPRVDHVHFFGFCIGNHPGLKRREILDLCGVLNSL